MEFQKILEIEQNLKNKEVQENFEKKVKNPFKMLIVSRYNIDGINYTLDFIKNKIFSEIIYVSNSGTYNDYIKSKNPQIQTVDYDYFPNIETDDKFKFNIIPDKSDKKGKCLYIFDTDGNYKYQDYRNSYWNTKGKQDFIINLKVSVGLFTYNDYDSKYLIMLDEDLANQEQEKTLIYKYWMRPYNAHEIDKLFLYNIVTNPFIISQDEDYYKS